MLKLECLCTAGTPESNLLWLAVYVCVQAGPSSMPHQRAELTLLGHWLQTENSRDRVEVSFLMIKHGWRRRRKNSARMKLFADGVDARRMEGRLRDRTAFKLNENLIFLSRHRNPQQRLFVNDVVTFRPSLVKFVKCQGKKNKNLLLLNQNKDSTNYTHS